MELLEVMDPLYLLTLLFKLVFLPLASWRLYRLFATDTGPYQILRKFRVFLGVKYAYKKKLNEKTGKLVTVYKKDKKTGKWKPEIDWEHWHTEDGSKAEWITCCWCLPLWHGLALTLLALFAPTWLFFLIVVPLNLGTTCLIFENKIWSK